MSHASIFSLSVLYKYDLVNYFGSEVATLFDSYAVAAYPEGMANLDKGRKALIASTRNDWFKDRAKKLLDLSGHERLRFLSEQTATHKYMHVTQLGSEAQPYESKTLSEYTLMKENDFDSVLRELNGLIVWCQANPKEAGNILDEYPENLLTAIEYAFFTLKPQDEALCGEEGEGADFFFCVLKTIGDLLRYTRQHKNLWAVYENNQMIF